MQAIKSLLFILTFLPALSYSDLNTHLNDFFNRCGGGANLSSADVYNGQKAGYATGGGVVVKNRVMNSNVVTINLPKFDAGCGGIDIFAGGFSFINRRELIDTMKSIGSNAQGYAFLLGLETVSPVVTNTMKQLQSWSNSINALNINSCETASQLVGAVWPKKTMANQQICRSVSGKNGILNDYVMARHNCANSSQFDNVMQSARNDAGYKDMLTDEFNIAWEAINRQKFLMNSPELANFFMSLMGTIIVKKDEKHTIVQTYPSKINDETFLKVLMEGGHAKSYICDSSRHVQNRCLNVKEVDLEISAANSWLGRIKDILVEMQNCILMDMEIPQAHQELLTKTRLPLYKIINVMTAYKKGYCPIDLYHVADIVAMDLLIQYLKESIDLVRDGAHQLKRSQMYSDEIDAYLEQLRIIEETVRYYETRASRQMEREFQTMQTIQLIEEQIASEIILR